MLALLSSTRLWPEVSARRDGGNIVHNGSVAIVAAKVFRENPDFSQIEIERAVVSLGFERVVFIPVEPGEEHDRQSPAAHTQMANERVASMNHRCAAVVVLGVIGRVAKERAFDESPVSNPDIHRLGAAVEDFNFDAPLAERTYQFPIN